MHRIPSSQVTKLEGGGIADGHAFVSLKYLHGDWHERMAPWHHGTISMRNTGHPLWTGVCSSSCGGNLVDLGPADVPTHSSSSLGLHRVCEGEGGGRSSASDHEDNHT